MVHNFTIKYRFYIVLKGIMMKTFLIQGNEITKCPEHDFGYAVFEAIKYNNWYYNEEKFDCDIIYGTFDGLKCKECIPVGSVEFVLNFLKTQYNIQKVSPINIPEELDSFSNRKIERKYNIDTIIHDHDVIIKSMTGIKKYTEILYGNVISNVPLDDYIISEVISIESEWRCFVRNNRLLDIKCYSGNPFLMPSEDIIYDMIDSYKKSPHSYTLDIALSDKGKTSIIEVHNFFSCGLYGFSDYGNYLNMLIDGINWEINKTI